MAEDLVVPSPSANEQESSDESSSSSGNENLRVKHILKDTMPFEICRKIALPAYMAAFLSGQKLIRDCKQILCDPSLLENVTGNYVIVRKILSFLPWQDKLVCKNVCSLWRSAVNTLQKEQIGPADFTISMRPSHTRHGIKLLQSDCFYTEPLVVLAFANTAASTITVFCEDKNINTCDHPCLRDHYFLDMVKRLVVAPKTCLLAVKSTCTSYMPLPLSKTNKLMDMGKKFGQHPFIGGIFIPVIPNVEFQIINIKSISDTQKNFIETIDKLSETRYVKGALVFVNDSFILQSVDDIKFLNYLSEVQPNVPYALGGCIVDDTVACSEDMATMVKRINKRQDTVSGNLISIGLFTVPKNFNDTRTENGCNFDMFSLVLETSDWSKTDIQSAINEFSRKVPHFEHSVVIKMSCVGRDSKHFCEQNLFRTAFPTTRLVGCYGNGELGINLPERKRTQARPDTVKRQRADHGPAHGIMYSYATIFTYIGWGRITKPAETT